MLALSGVPEARAREGARGIVRLERAIATISLPVEQRRDSRKLFHKKPRAWLANCRSLALRQ